MLMEEVKAPAQSQVCGPTGDLTVRLLDIYLLRLARPVLAETANVRGQVYPIENIVLQKLLRIQKSPGVLKGASF